MTPAMILPFAAAVGATVAAGFAFRIGRDSAHRALAAALALAALEASAGLAVSLDPVNVRAPWLFARESACALGAGVWVWFAATYAREETAERTARRWKPLPFAAAAAVGILAGGGYLFIADPRGGAPILATAGVWVHAAAVVAAVTAILQLERTFAASIGSLRWRLKFTIFGAGTILAARLFAGSQLLTTRRLDPALEVFSAAGLIAGTLLIIAGLRRRGTVALSVYPSRDVLRRSVTVLLAGIYLLLVGAIASAGTRFSGVSAFPPITFLCLAALLALAVAFHSDRARWRLRRLLGQSFGHPLHDVRGVWLRITAATSRCAEPAELGRAVTGLVASEFHALSVTLWLLDPRRGVLDPVASTAGTSGADVSGALSGPAAADLAAHLRANPGAADLESAPGTWAEALRTANPPVFARRPHRAFVPVVDHGDCQGVLVLGDRVDGRPFLREDLEILECVASQVAARLQGLRLSQTLAEARQLEAFQGMAAFFIHDLKNASFLLSLMLQNFSTHLENPDFRADALRSVATACGHLNDLIRRLGNLREGLRIETAETDLNEVVAAAVGEVPRPGTVAVETALAPLPRIRADRGQLRKVVTNLLLNATEAMDGEGHIRVATTTEEGWAVLTVGDNGRGMSERFVRESLFRPFRTTKPSGLGIGMFQSRSIVEAHGGRITVSSRPGEGTVFRVFLRAGAVA